MRGFHRREPGPSWYETNQCSSLQPRHAPIPASRKEGHRAVSADYEPGGISEAYPQAFGCNVQPSSALLFFKLNLQQFISTEVFLPFFVGQGSTGKCMALTQLSSPCSLASCKCSLCMSARCTSSRWLVSDGTRQARTCAYHPPTFSK